MRTGQGRGVFDADLHQRGGQSPHPRVGHLFGIARRLQVGQVAGHQAGAAALLQGDLAGCQAVGPFTQPFKMDYTPGAYTKIGAFNQASQDVYLQFIGVNTDDGTPIAADIFRTRLKPAKEISFITDDYVDFELGGSVLADMTRQASSADGQFYSISI